MNRRFSCSLALLVLFCVSPKTHSQELLPQQVAGDGAALSVVQWVKPRTAGVLKGDIFAPVSGGASVVVEDAVIVLRGKNGWVGEGTTNRLGRFTVTDVEPGVYSMMVKGPGVFAFYALQVAAENDVDTHTYPDRVTVPCAFIDEAAVNRLAKHVNGELTLDEIVVAPEGLAVGQDGDVSGSTSSLVTLTDGKLSGVLLQPGSGFEAASSMNVTLFQDGREVATAVTQPDGKFEIGGLRPGIYAFVAHGKSGVSVVGIEAIEQAKKDGQARVGGHSSGQRFVTMLTKVL